LNVVLVNLVRTSLVEFTVGKRAPSPIPTFIEHNPIGLRRSERAKHAFVKSVMGLTAVLNMRVALFSTLEPLAVVNAVTSKG